jgi:hypothetical protein
MYRSPLAALWAGSARRPSARIGGTAEEPRGDFGGTDAVAPAAAGRTISLAPRCVHKWAEAGSDATSDPCPSRWARSCRSSPSSSAHSVKRVRCRSPCSGRLCAGTARAAHARLIRRPGRRSRLTPSRTVPGIDVPPPTMPRTHSGARSGRCRSGIVRRPNRLLSKPSRRASHGCAESRQSRP